MFRDWTDLEIGQLKEQLRGELAASRYLIVICSENSAKPNAKGKRWIDEEVRMFLDLYPENIKRIIPVIYRKKGGKEADFYLPESIREHELLAADVLDKGEARVLNDVVARMVGVKPDELWDRHGRERRMRLFLTGMAVAVFALLACMAASNHPNLMAAAGLVLVLLVLAVIWWCRSYFGRHVVCYGDYIERNNVPEGLYELTPAQVKRLSRHYRFTICQHRLRSVEYCNSAGRLQEHEEPWRKERPAAMVLEYKEGSREVIACVHLDAQGMEVSKRKFSPNCIDFVQMVGVGDVRMEVAQSASLVTSLAEKKDFEANSAVGRFFVQRNEGGLVVRELFCRANSLIPTVDAQGVGGREYVLDSAGRPIELRYLAVQAARVASSTEARQVENLHGVGGYRFAYIGDPESPAMGQVNVMTAINDEGAPTLNEEHWAICRRDYDAFGNLCQEAYFDADGRPCRHKEGYALVRRSYDENGHERVVSAHGTDGARCMTVFGFSYRITVFDGQGNCTKVAFYDEHEKLHCRENGFAIVTKEYDEKGRETATAYYGEDEKPCRSREGFARFHKVYDELSGNLKREDYEDEQGEPCLNAGGYASAVWDYDEYGKMVRKSFYDTGGRACTSTDGYAYVQWSYGPYGNRTGEAYCAADGSPCLHKDGHARMEWAYDDKGRLLSITRFDLAGNALPVGQA